MESLRLRLEFQNPDILSHAQKSQGLERTWILVQQPLTNLASLSAHILQVFHLNHSCPHGLLLSMDGFALPSFVSINILKDNDVISVQKIDHPTVTGSDTFDEVGRQHLEIDCVGNETLLLSNDKFDQESRGCEIKVLDDESAEESEELNLEAYDPLGGGNGISKRRKASQKLQGSKKKKQRSELREAAATGIHRESEFIEIPLANEVPSEKKGKSKKKSSKTGNHTIGDPNARHDEENIRVTVSASNLKINEQYPENGKDDDATNVSSIMIGQFQKEGLDQLRNEGHDQPKGLLHMKQFAGKISEGWNEPDGENQNHKTCGNLDWKPGEENQNHETHGNSNIERDTENDVVPIEIQPGHIVSEALEEDRGVPKDQPQIFKPKYVPRKCYNFIQGTCSRGAICRFSHSVPDKTDVSTKENETHSKQCNNVRRNRVVPQECRYFIQGRCTRGSCPYLHSVPDKTGLGMEGTVKGTETYGEQCDLVPLECIDLIQGECNQRTSWRLIHSVQDKTDGLSSSFHNKYYQGVTSSSKISDACAEDQSSSFIKQGKSKALPEVCSNYTQGRCSKESHCLYLHQDLDVTVGLGSTISRVADKSRYSSKPKVCKYHRMGNCRKGLKCQYVHQKQDLTGSGYTYQVVDTKRKSLSEVCWNSSQGSMQKNNNLVVEASRAIPEHADGGPFDNENGVPSMSFGSNEKYTDSMVKGNVDPKQDNSAQAPSTPETGVDLWEQALDSKKEEVSKESSWGKKPSSNNLSYSAFNASTSSPTMLYRG